MRKRINAIIAQQGSPTPFAPHQPRADLWADARPDGDLAKGAKVVTVDA
jgi:hypothetical protein